MIVSAGGIVYRKRKSDGVIEVKLITTASWKFTLPKGRVEGKDTLEDTAIREVKEEAGAEGEIEVYLGKAQWKLRSGDRKTVHIYLMKLVKDGKINDPDNETLSASWKTLDQAVRLVEFLPMRKFLFGAIKHLNAEKAVLCEHCFNKTAVFLDWCELCLNEAKESLEKKKTKKSLKKG